MDHIDKIKKGGCLELTHNTVEKTRLLVESVFLLT
jgi:hypothetical protein